MNIFVLDKDPVRCAHYHCDKHVVKMILESAQMLSTAVRLSGIDMGYQLTHANHPCSLWARESLSNWQWLRQLAKELNNEYRFRFDKEVNHKSYDLITTLPAPSLPDVGLTPFAQAMPDEFRHKNPVTAYRRYYRQGKSHLLSWNRKRGQPAWIKRIEVLSL